MKKTVSYMVQKLYEEIIPSLKDVCEIRGDYLSITYNNTQEQLDGIKKLSFVIHAISNYKLDLDFGGNLRSEDGKITIDDIIKDIRSELFGWRLLEDPTDLLKRSYKDAFGKEVGYISISPTSNSVKFIKSLSGR